MILGQEDPLEKEMAIHSSTIAWKIPWTEEPGGLQSMESLITLVIVSFAVQKLLSLIRSHLFAFAPISVTLGGGS